MRFLLFAVLLIAHTNLMASDFRRVGVFLNLSDKAKSECELSSQSVKAQIETVLRSNNIDVVDTLIDIPVINVDVFGGKTLEGGCLGHASLAVSTYFYSLRLPWASRPLGGTFNICEKSFAFSGPKGYEQQKNVNTVLADLTRQCVSQVLKALKKS